MAHRNRWFTELNSMVIFHGELLNKQRVYTNGAFTVYGFMVIVIIYIYIYHLEYIYIYDRYFLIVLIDVTV